jgi:predicted ATP-grasp superfamily ATP-dependent carboligase
VHTKSNKENGFAVVLGLGVNGLGHIRSLSQKGISVFGIYTSQSELGRYSRFCKAISFSKEQKNKITFKERLIQIAKSLPQKPVLFSTSDFYVYFVSEFRDELSKYFYLNMPDSDTINVIVNKHLMSELAQKNGLKVPETYYLLSNQTVTRLSGKMNFPCLIKPINAFSVEFPQKTILIHCKEDLESFYHLNSQFLGKTIVQELIPGAEHNIYQCTVYFDTSSVPLVAFTMRKLRQYPPFFGVTSYGISVTNAELIGKTNSFLKKIKYKGFCSLEYKWDQKRKKFYFIELNPRLPHYSSLFYSSGINLPYIAYSDQKYSGNKKYLKKAQQAKISWIHFHFDLATFLARKKMKQKISFTQWLRSILYTNSFAYWDKRDPLPCVRSFFNLVKFIKYKTLNN